MPFSDWAARTGSSVTLLSLNETFFLMTPKLNFSVTGLTPLVAELHGRPVVIGASLWKQKGQESVKGELSDRISVVFCHIPAWGQMVEPLWGVCWCNKPPIRSARQAGQVQRRLLLWWPYSRLCPCGQELLSVNLYIRNTDTGVYRLIQTQVKCLKRSVQIYMAPIALLCPLERMHPGGSSCAFLIFAVIRVKGFAETNLIVIFALLFYNIFNLNLKIIFATRLGCTLHLFPCRFLLQSIPTVMERSSRVDEGGVGVRRVL